MSMIIYLITVFIKFFIFFISILHYLNLYFNIHFILYFTYFIFRECHQPINFPQHKDFELIDCIEDANTPLKSRWCLIYKKKE